MTTLRGHRGALILNAEIAAERLRRRAKNARGVNALTLNLSVDEADSYAMAIENIVAIAKIGYTHEGAETSEAPPSPPTEGRPAA